jgi:glycosyltransferase involved in cell wall biosynthesis
VRAGVRAGGRLWRLGRWLFSTHPRTLLWRDWEAPRATLQQWSAQPYDLVWFSHAAAYLALGDLVTAPHIVDLDNLDSSVLRHRRRNLVRAAVPWRQQLVGWAGVAADAVDSGRWRRLEHAITRAGTSVVCSELDRGRLGGTGVWVVPNGYERVPLPARTDPRPPRPDGPVLLMVGLLTYEPNSDAAAYFATAVLPRVRLRCPDARFHVVGRYDSAAAVDPWRNLPGVTVLGEVEDVTAELTAADIAVVPIRFGGGTRIKILEAFAYGLPVVCTTIGCEGLDVHDGEHLLVADDPAAFAAACLRLYEDGELRARVVAAAAQLWSSRYRWTVTTPAIVTAVQAARGRGPRPTGHPDSQTDHPGPRPGEANQ